MATFGASHALADGWGGAGLIWLSVRHGLDRVSHSGQACLCWLKSCIGSCLKAVFRVLPLCVLYMSGGWPDRPYLPFAATLWRKGGGAPCFVPFALRCVQGVYQPIPGPLVLEARFSFNGPLFVSVGLVPNTASTLRLMMSLRYSGIQHVVFSSGAGGFDRWLLAPCAASGRFAICLCILVMSLLGEAAARSAPCSSLLCLARLASLSCHAHRLRSFEGVRGCRHLPGGGSCLTDMAAL